MKLITINYGFCLQAMKERKNREGGEKKAQPSVAVHGCFEDRESEYCRERVTREMGEKRRQLGELHGGLKKMEG